MSRISRLALVALSLVAVVAGCDRVTSLEPSAPRPTAPARALLDPVTGLLGVHLLNCPSDVSRSTSGVVGPEGGSLVLDGFRVDFPAGAVDSTRTFVLSVPASSYLEIEVHAEGFAHYIFARPVDVTLDASRCGLLPSGLQVWNIDSESKALLEPMGGVLDLLTHRIRFSTFHFSGYSIAW